MPKICPKCHTENRDEASICLKCGHRMTVIEQVGSAVRYCNAGKHPMDPAWGSCPYCSDSQTASQEPPPGPVARRKTEVEDDRQQKGAEAQPNDKANQRHNRKGTEFGQTLLDESPPTPSQLGQAGVRRMVALVVTYTWRPEGQVFPIYEGRNYLGRDEECEVRLIADPQLSGKHAAILYRGKAFVITDEKSMNGTLVNGVEAPLTGMPLTNYAEIRTGATLWKFLVIEPQIEAVPVTG
ncbi:MAG TPA: FHA domain-containing protein [Pyrinomonadaceae bacterium]|nr:FHA domain-containing protein [Pyrinomonadaceae bacterium]